MPLWPPLIPDHLHEQGSEVCFLQRWKQAKQQDLGNKWGAEIQIQTLPGCRPDSVFLFSREHLWTESLSCLGPGSQALRTGLGAPWPCPSLLIEGAVRSHEAVGNKPPLQVASWRICERKYSLGSTIGPLEWGEDPRQKRDAPATVSHSDGPTHTFSVLQPPMGFRLCPRQWDVTPKAGACPRELVFLQHLAGPGPGQVLSQCLLMGPHRAPSVIMAVGCVDALPSAEERLTVGLGSLAPGSCAPWGRPSSRSY